MSGRAICFVCKILNHIHVVGINTLVFFQPIHGRLWNSLVHAVNFVLHHALHPTEHTYRFGTTVVTDNATKKKRRGIEGCLAK